MINPITLTTAAVAHLQTMMTKKPDAKGFRLSIKKTGCSGYAYVPEIVDTVNTADLSFVADQGLPVFIDTNSVEFLKDIVVDYVADDTQGLKQKRLVFINPQEKNRCGCGESFQI